MNCLSSLLLKDKWSIRICDFQRQTDQSCEMNYLLFVYDLTILMMDERIQSIVYQIFKKWLLSIDSL